MALKKLRCLEGTCTDQIRGLAYLKAIRSAGLYAWGPLRAWLDDLCHKIRICQISQMSILWSNSSRHTIDGPQVYSPARADSLEEFQSPPLLSA